MSSTPLSTACATPPPHHTAYGLRRAENRRRKAAAEECEKEKRDEAMREGPIHAIITASSSATTRDAKGFRRKARRTRRIGSRKRRRHIKRSTKRRH